MTTPLRLLLVEDTPGDAALLLRLLRREGYAVASARVETAGAMAGALDRQAWDLVISDYSLPAFSANAALALLQRRRIDLPLIVVSGTISDELVVACMKRGAADYLLKDRLGRLGEAVRRTLAERRLRDEQRQAEDSLREAEARYRGIFEVTADGVIILDPQGRIVEANPALCRMHGCSREELIGRPTTVLIHPDYRDCLAMFLQGVAAEGTFHGRLVDLRSDATPLHVEIRGTSFSYRDRPHLLWVIHDVTTDVEAHRMLEQRAAERTRELTTLLEVAGSLASTLDLEPLLGLILEQLRRVVDYTHAGIRVVQGEDLVILEFKGPGPRDQLVGRPGPWPGVTAVCREVIRRQAPVIIDDMRGDTPLARAMQEGAGAWLESTLSYLRSWLGVPLLLKERVLGVLGLTHAEPGYYTRRHAELAMAIASHIAVAMENARFYRQVQEVAITEERARLARELHDSLAQVLFYVNTQAEAALTLLRAGQAARVEEQLGELAQAARDAYADVREGILALRTAGATPGLLEGLTSYLPIWQGQSGVRAELLITPAGASLPALSPAAEVQVVRIVQEALANVRKHAQARRVRVRIGAAAGRVSVAVEDDGVGFDPTAQGPGPSPQFGLATMRERAAAAGGRLEIDSVPGAGTRVVVHLPAAAPHDPQSV